MKLFHKISAVAASIMALSSCVEEAIEPLTGEYQEPGVYTMTELLSQETIAGEGYKTFVVEVASEGVTGKAGEYKGTGNALELHFLGEGYKLASTTYAAATPDKAQKGTYLTGDKGSKYYTIKDGKAEALLIDNGGIKVNETEEGYTLEGIIWLENGDVVEVSCKAKLVYEKVLTKLTQALTVTSNVANGTKSVTMNLASEGVTSEYDPNTWSNVYKGTGNYLAIDVYSADGFVYPGTYKPCAKSGELAEGEYQIGWDPGDIYNIGMMFTNWGTCWWTVTDGATSAAHITKGNITIELDAEGIYTLTVDNGDVYAIYEGPLGDVTPEVKGQYKMTQAFSAVNNAPYGKETVTVKLATKKLVATPSKSGVYSFTGTGEYVSLELASADGTLAPGTYTTADKTLKAGVIKDNGTGVVEGSFLSHVTDGKEAPTSVELILDGQVEVALNGDVYTIVATFGGNTCTYEGSVTVVTPEVKEDEPLVAYTEYTMEEKVEDAYDMTGAVVAKKHTITLTKGDDVVAIFELLAEDGADIAGTYTCQEWAAAPGLMGNGYSMPEYGVEGGSRYWVDGQLVLINAGETLDVTKVENGLYSFKGSTGYYFAASTDGYVPAFEMEEKVEDAYDMTGAVVAKKHTITLTKGDDVAAIFELLAEDGVDIAGTYTCQEWAAAPGLMGNGYAYPEYGIEGGSRYWADDQLITINAGETLEVIKVNDNLYCFKGSTGYSFVAYLAL